MDTNKYLAIYLTDHHAGAVAGADLARRSANSNRGTPYEKELVEVTEEIAEDKVALETIMDALGVRPHRLKDGLSWAAEKLGRGKLNGEITSYSPLSRVVELEGLTAGILVKRALWVSLLELSGTDQRLDRSELEELVARAERQAATVSSLRDRAAAEAFTANGSGS